MAIKYEGSVSDNQRGRCGRKGLASLAHRCWRSAKERADLVRDGGLAIIGHFVGVVCGCQFRPKVCKGAKFVKEKNVPRPAESRLRRVRDRRQRERVMRHHERHVHERKGNLLHELVLPDVNVNRGHHECRRLGLCWCGLRGLHVPGRYRRWLDRRQRKCGVYEPRRNGPARAALAARQPIPAVKYQHIPGDILCCLEPRPTRFTPAGDRRLLQHDRGPAARRRGARRHQRHYGRQRLQSWCVAFASLPPIFKMPPSMWSE